MQTVIDFWKKYKLLQALWATVLVSISGAQSVHSCALFPAVASRVLRSASYSEEDRIFDLTAKKRHFRPVSMQQG